MGDAPVVRPHGDRARSCADEHLEKWDEVYVAAVGDLKAGKFTAGYHAYGYNTPGTSGADLLYSEQRAFNAAVPAAVVTRSTG